MAKRIGETTSGVVEMTTGGNKFFKVKIKLLIENTLEGKLSMTHPTMGVIKIYISYERLNRMCWFCAKIGHEMDNCPDKTHLERLKLDPRFKDRQELTNIPSQRIGSWIVNPTQIPRSKPGFSQSPNRRATIPPSRSPIENRRHRPNNGLDLNDNFDGPVNLNLRESGSESSPCVVYGENRETSHAGFKRTEAEANDQGEEGNNEMSGETREGTDRPLTKRRMVGATRKVPPLDQLVP